MTEAKTKDTPTILSKSTWLSLILLGFAGQLAWGVENQYFNTFMYDNITPDPRPISWMVAASAITATLTTILMGAFSDQVRSRWGRRKPFILLGYLAWGVLTAAFTMVPGPLIGGWLTAQFGIPTIIDGQAGFIPTPLIFQVAGLATLGALMPMAFVKERIRKRND